MKTEADPALEATIAAPVPGVTTHPFAVGQRLCGRYTVDQLLGEGTFGWVYAAVTANGKRVAVKVLKPEFAKESSLFARFKRRELETLRRIHGAAPTPNVVRPLEDDILVERGLSLLVLEHIKGPTLDELIAKERGLDPEEARDLARGIAQGISRIHASGGVHRDLKPENIRLRDGIVPVILDLGIAKAMWETQTLTATGQNMMTPLYAAPEQLGGGEVGPACDVYAFGLILFEMLTGTVPLAGRTLVETLQARLSQHTPDPRAFGRPLPSALAVLSMQCIDRDPAKRPTADQIIVTLDGPRSNPTLPPPAASGPILTPRHGEPLSPLAASVPLTSRLSGSAAQNPLVVAVATVGVIVLIVFGVLAVNFWPKRTVHAVTAGATASSPIASSPSNVAAAPTMSVAAPPTPREIDVRLRMTSDRLTAGEPVKVTIDVDSAAFVALAVVDDAGNAEFVLPRGDASPPRIQPGRPRDFPSEEDRKGGLVMRASLPNGKAETNERLVAFAVEDRDLYAAVFGRGAARGRGPPVDSVEKELRAKGAVFGRAEIRYSIVRRR